MLRPLLLPLGAGILLLALSVPSLQAVEASALSPAERLQKLEQAVRLLQERNLELETEVHQLKQREVFAPVLPSSQNQPIPGNDNKTVFRAPPPPPVEVRPGGSEYKLTLGGYIQANFEDGDVSAFEGRFGATALKDLFRVRRARITLSGDFKDDFDFKIQGEFELSDSAITALKTVNRQTGQTTTVTNSNRVQFAGTDIFINWHPYPEASVKVGQYKSPFGLEFLTPSTQLLTIERSLPSSALVAD